MYDLMYDLFIDLFLLIIMLNAKEPGDLTGPLALSHFFNDSIVLDPATPSATRPLPF